MIKNGIVFKFYSLNLKLQSLLDINRIIIKDRFGMKTAKVLFCMKYAWKRVMHESVYNFAYTA